MWLIPAGANDICLLGNRGLGAECTTRSSAEQRGLISATVSRRGATEIHGIMPQRAMLKVQYKHRSLSVIATNPDGAFAVKLARLALSFSLTTPSGRTITLPGTCTLCRTPGAP